MLIVILMHTVTIGMVGKYIDLADSYKSLSEALIHAGIQTRTRVNIDYIDSEELEQQRCRRITGKCGCYFSSWWFW